MRGSQLGCSAWRIVQGGRVLCGSQDVVDSIDELNERLASINLGRPTAIQMPSELDVRLILEGGTQIDFLGSFSEDDDHVFHVFGPDHLYLEYSMAKGWEIGTSIHALN